MRPSLRSLLVAPFALLVLSAPARSAVAQGAEAGAPADSVRLSDGEKLEQAEEALSMMREIHKQALKVWREAREENDVVKVNCVNEKLTQIKGLLNVSEQAKLSLQESIGRREVDASEHEFTKISLAREKIIQLRSEAEECIGQLAYVVEEQTRLEVEEPDDLPTNPFETVLNGPVVVRAPFASPSGSE